MWPFSTIDPHTLTVWFSFRVQVPRCFLPLRSPSPPLRTLSPAFIASLATKLPSSQGNAMRMNSVCLLRNTIFSKEPAWLLLSRTYAAGGKAKKGGKGSSTADGPKSALTKEVKSATCVGANILKDGTDPKVPADAECPDWLWHLLDKRPPLSELQRREAESLSYEDLKRFVKLDNRARIKENNSAKAKN